MPIYEYKCKQCGEKFDVYLFSHSESSVICEECGSTNTERILSSFSSAANTGSSSCRPNSGFR